jgi:hypothetical protein
MRMATPIIQFLSPTNTFREIQLVTCSPKFISTLLNSIYIILSVCWAGITLNSYERIKEWLHRDENEAYHNRNRKFRCFYIL